MSSDKPEPLPNLADAADISSQKSECFVIMPITDPDGYSKGHFGRVFDDIFAPACEKAGFEAVHAGRVRQTNLIHLDILQRLLHAPMALCDLSTRNPNVLFELGLRQAFDMPVVLVREGGTQDIFDIAPLRYTEYRKERIYHEVLEDQNSVAEAIRATQEAFQSGQGVNSIIKLLALTKPASLTEYQEAEKDPVLQIIRAEMSQLRAEFRQALRVREAIRPPLPSIPKAGTDEWVEWQANILRRRIFELKAAIQEAEAHGGTGKEKAKTILETIKTRLVTIDSAYPFFLLSDKQSEILNNEKKSFEEAEIRFNELPLSDDEIPF